MLINARGLSCPQPVILAKEAVDKGEKEVEVLVDDGAPKENVPRFLTNAGYKVTVKEDNDEDGYVITAIK
ncbi:TusA-related sulfurtransferase [Hathewaya proteolytica DSM 3090]|uniref:TusA-related sulfurtransferase n=1 Tax=Hathewaya proteolytica DSM 3090 TaxID=1121331 RepID=A0A1M6QMR2_9CLOT|nr:sulfurtransferase TusA family protein [Hathewaya proteolytica]SHK21317.1 TusA-related sulfurtransferase [Hathewaya proteolytica DSM 3090]